MSARPPDPLRPKKAKKGSRLMKKLSKLLAVFVALAMCLTLLPMSALAAEAKAGERYSCGLAEHQHDDKCGDK